MFEYPKQPQEASPMIPDEIMAQAAVAVREAVKEGWDGSPRRLHPTSHSWVAKPGQQLNSAEFMFNVGVNVDGQEYIFHHTPRTGAYNKK